MYAEKSVIWKEPVLYQKELLFLSIEEKVYSTTKKRNSTPEHFCKLKGMDNQYSAIKVNPLENNHANCTELT